jgi:phage terminase large subunit
MEIPIKLTKKQTEARKILNDPKVENVLLYGGARSGKTWYTILQIIMWCLEYQGFRALIARLRFNHAKTSLWYDTLDSILRMLPEWSYTPNRGDWYVRFANGSEIWMGGLDEKERMEKVLGHEYNVIYLNEVSQIGVGVLEMALPRLAKKTERFSNKAIFDCNPPSLQHWSRAMFFDYRNPVDKTMPVDSRKNVRLQINPEDNRENLPPGYIESRLLTLPPRARARFYDGEYTHAEGMVFDAFDDSMVISRADVPKDDDGDELLEEVTVGVDFGLHMAAVRVGWIGESVYILDDYGYMEPGVYGIPAAIFDKQMRTRWPGDDYIAYCDPSGGERVQEITNGTKADNDLEAGIDKLLWLMHNGLFFVCDNARGVLGEIYDYHRDKNGKVVKESDHYISAMRYGVYSRIAHPVQIFV